MNHRHENEKNALQMKKNSLIDMFNQTKNKNIEQIQKKFDAKMKELKNYQSFEMSNFDKITKGITKPCARIQSIVSSTTGIREDENEENANENQQANNEEGKNEKEEKGKEEQIENGEEVNKEQNENQEEEKNENNNEIEGEEQHLEQEEKNDNEENEQNGENEENEEDNNINIDKEE